MDARVGCGRPGRGEGTAEPTANRLGSHLVLFKCRQFKLLFWSKWYYLLWHVVPPFKASIILPAFCRFPMDLPAFARPPFQPE